MSEKKVSWIFQHRIFQYDNLGRTRYVNKTAYFALRQDRVDAVVATLLAAVLVICRIVT